AKRSACAERERSPNCPNASSRRKFSAQSMAPDPVSFANRQKHLPSPRPSVGRELLRHRNPPSPNLPVGSGPHKNCKSGNRTAIYPSCPASESWFRHNPLPTTTRDPIRSNVLPIREWSAIDWKDESPGHTSRVPPVWL